MNSDRVINTNIKSLCAQIPGDLRSPDRTESKQLIHPQSTQDSNFFNNKKEKLSNRLITEDSSLPTADFNDFIVYKKQSEYRREFKAKRRLFKPAHNIPNDALISITGGIFSTANETSFEFKQENAVNREPFWAPKSIQRKPSLRDVRIGESTFFSGAKRVKRGIWKTGKTEPALEPSNQAASSNLSTFVQRNYFVYRTPTRKPHTRKLEQRIRRNRFQGVKVQSVKKMFFVPLPIPLAPFGFYSTDIESQKFLLQITDLNASQMKSLKPLPRRNKKRMDLRRNFEAFDN